MPKTMRIYSSSTHMHSVNKLIFHLRLFWWCIARKIVGFCSVQCKRCKTRASLIRNNLCTKLVYLVVQLNKWAKFSAKTDFDRYLTSILQNVSINQQSKTKTNLKLQINVKFQRYFNVLVSNISKIQYCVSSSSTSMTAKRLRGVLR